MMSVALLLAGISQSTTGWGLVTEPNPLGLGEGLHVSMAALESSSGSVYLHSFWNGDDVFQDPGYHVFDFTPGQTVHAYAPPDIDAPYLEVIPSVDDQVILLGMSAEFSDQALCYQVRSATGNLIRNTTLVEYMDAQEVDAAIDPNGIAHVAACGSGQILYLAFDPEDASVLWLDTLAESSWDTPAIAVDDRVHVVFNTGPYGNTYYVQYDLQGNQTVPPVSMTFSSYFSIALDPDGDPFVFLKEGVYFRVYKLDRETGDPIFGPVQIGLGPSNPGKTATEILPCGTADTGAFYLLWVSNGNELEFNVMANDGTIEYAPPYAYSYGDPSQVYRFVACATTGGFIFTGDFEGCLIQEPPIPPHMMYWEKIHSFTPGLGVEGEGGGTDGCAYLGASCNPFTSSVTITCGGETLPEQLTIYDVTGRPVLSLTDHQGSSFTWDGLDSSGMLVPAGTYLVRGAVDGQVASIRLVRL